MAATNSTVSSKVVWENTVRNMEGTPQSVYAIAFQPNGELVVAGVGHRVLVYEASTGELIKGLKGHKGNVYAVAFSRDSARFASGSADKHVIIWTAELQGILRYKHHDPVYCLAYNPVTLHLLSCTGSDIGLWSPEKHQVDKTKVSSKVVACDWTPDGQNMALGLWDGSLSIRTKDGSELVSVSLGSDPVWALAWRPSARGSPVLAVGDWSQTLSFFSVTGRRLGRRVSLGFDPTSLTFWSNGPDDEYLLVGGSNSELALYSPRGVRISTLAKANGWVWAAAPCPGTNALVLGTARGSIGLHDVEFSTVHALHGDTYASRKGMTSVVVQSLLSDQKSVLPCKAHILKLAVYGSRLAVQVPDGILVFDKAAAAASAKTSDVYRLIDKLNIVQSCSLMMILAQHVVLCDEHAVTLFDMTGSKVRDWRVPAPVRFVKVVGGPSGGEGLLVGLRSGSVVKIFVNAAFPVNLVEVGASIRCLDLSASRSKLAVVDEHHSLLVYDLASGELVHSEPGANAVAFNARHEHMLAYSTLDGTIKIKAGAFPSIERRVPGYVVGFMASSVFCLEEHAMKIREIPQSGPLHQYLQAKDFTNAYAVACLGVTESDWRALASDALLNLQLPIARKSFTRIRELRYIELVDSIERAAAAPDADDSALMAQILAFQGKISQAAKLYERASRPQAALDMYVDLGRMKDAEAIAAKHAIPMEHVLQKREASVVDSGDWRALTELYLSSGQYLKVVTTVADALAGAGSDSATGDKLAVLANLVADVSAQEKDALREAAKILRAHEQDEAALEAYAKVGDIKSLVELHVKLANWKDAFAVVADVPAYTQDVYIPYAEWLLERDEFEASIRALAKSGARDRAVRLLEALITNAVSEDRFGAGAHYYWWLASVYLNEVTSTVAALTAADRKKLKKFSVYYYKAEIYYAFQYVKAYIDEPFNPHLGSQDAVFNITRYLLTRIDRVAPKGVSKVYTLIATARLSLDMGAFTLARSCLDKLTHLVVPHKWLYELDAMAIATRSKLKDSPDVRDMHPVCARCGAVNGLVPRGGACSSCHHEFQVSFYSFDTLPLVEFVLPDMLSHAQAMDLLSTDSLAKAIVATAPDPNAPAVPTFTIGAPGGAGAGAGAASSDRGTWRESSTGGAQTLSLDPSSSATPVATDALVGELFGDQLMAVTSSDTYIPFTINNAGLTRLDVNQVLIREWPCPAMRTQYYLNVTPALPIYSCPTCNHFFHEEDYELHVLDSGSCPACAAAFPGVNNDLDLDL